MQNLKFFRYLAYSIEILVFFILGSTPSLFPEIFGATACLLVSIALTIAVFENEVPAMIFGVVCGALTDLGFSNSIGLFTISLTIICFLLGFCANNIFAANFYNVMLSAVFIITAILSLHFVFIFVVKGYDNASTYYINHYISRIVQTILCTAFFYFVNKFVYETLSD